MNSPAAVVFDNLSGFARECLDIADDAVSKAASLAQELETVKQREVLVLTKVANLEARKEEALPLAKVAAVVDRLIKTNFVKRSNRAATIEGIMEASKEDVFAILEKLASIAICPMSALNREDDGEVVVKAAGKTTEMSKSDSIWSNALQEARDEVGA